MTARTETLDEMGNRDAEPGSRDWAIGVLREIQSTLNDVSADAAHLKVMIGLFREHKGYRLLTNRRGRPFGIWDQFCHEPQPFGLGIDPEQLDATIAARVAREAKERAEVVDGKPIKDVGPPTKEEKNNVDNINIRDTGAGTSADYLTARIARDHPEILERMKAGEFPSVRAAAREAGIVQPSFQCPNDPLKASRRLLKHFKDDALITLVTELANHAGFNLTAKE